MNVFFFICLWKDYMISSVKTQQGGMVDMQGIVEAYTSYLINHKGYSSSTAQSYRRMLERFIGRYRITDIEQCTVATVDDYLDERIDRGLKVDSNALFMNCIRSFLRYCNRTQGANFNIDSYEVPRRKGRRTDYITAEELMRMLDVCPRERDRLMMLVAYTSGCRASELLQMTVESLRENCWTCIVKGGKEHTYYFDANVADRLRLMLYMLNIHTGPVWRSTNGKPITISAYAMTVRNTAKKAQISHRVSTHQLRHGFATAMMENGTDIRTLAEMMGHNSIQTTERYLHVTDSRMKEQHNLHAPQVVDATFPQFNTGAQAEWWKR